MGRLLIIDEDELASIVEDMIERRENECRPRGYQRESSCGGGITYGQLLYGGCGPAPIVSSCGTFSPPTPGCGGYMYRTC